jgi:sugar/nucleoside kinase (ribokinase family)
LLVTACGIAVTDIIAADLPRIAEPGEIVFGPRGNEIHIGGHTCNVTVDLVQMGIKGEDVSAIIPIGRDHLGSFLEEALRSRGIVTHPLRVNARTSSNLILVVKGEDRRFHADVGANLHMDPEMVMGIVRVERPTIFYIGATGWLGRFDEKLSQVCREVKGMKSLILASVIAPYGKDWSYIYPSLRYIDIFHGNVYEASHITGVDDPFKAAGIIAKQGSKVILISAGEKGLYAMVKGRIIIAPSFKVDTVDPTGAGDAFCAGVMYKLLNEPYRSTIESDVGLESLSLEDWKDVLMYALACGAACCTATGTTTAVRPEIIQGILESQAEEFMSNVEVK